MARLNRIQEVLKKKKVTQQWLSNEARLTYASVNQYVNGKREPSLPTLRKIADALKVSMKDLVVD
jgi:putative transcriptional regulator